MTKVITAFLAIIILTPEAEAEDLLRFKSKFLGDGVFEYELDFPDDRFIDFVNFDSVDFSGWQSGIILDSEFADKWSETTRGWRHDPIIWETVPYASKFRLKANSDAYQVSNVTIVFTYHMYPWAALDGLPNSMETPPKTRLYVNMPCLIPCQPSVADDSPPEQIATSPGFTEVRIDSLIFTRGRPTGIKFEVHNGMPVKIETSNDLGHWVNIGNTKGTRGLTTWHFARPSDAENQYFRVVVGP
jgi:hypothetical protein